VVYDGDTGAMVEELVPAAAGLLDPGKITFDADGNLFTSITTQDGGPRPTIVRVDHSTQAVSTFVPANYGGLLNVHGLTFGPDGHLYVADASGHQILRYDGSTGTFLGTFVSPGQGLIAPSDLLFGPDRTGDLHPDLYVSSNGSDQVLMFDGANPNTPLGVLVQAGSGGGFTAPTDMAFGPHGNLYVVFGDNSNNYNDIEQVYRFDEVTGALIDTPVAVGSGLVGATAFLTFDDRGDLFVSSQRTSQISRYSAGPVVTLSEPSETTVTVSFSTASGSATSGNDFSALSGVLTFLPGEMSKRILITPHEDVTFEPAETLNVNLSDPQGAVIVDGQGVVTIHNRQTKFFVVDDRPSLDAFGRPVQDTIFKYESSGFSIVANDFHVGPQNVRGVASNTGGTRQWTIDSNGTVSVTDHRNLPLGSWIARGLIQPEGIASNGTDIWIVDARSDKVFKYAGAASRLSGSQNATSSFNLNSSNRDPKDIVTDGASLWVVNDSSSADKVFKYKLSGSLVGSWTITTSGATSPTGITLDPANPSDLWIVDNGTDRVYQYTAAVSKTSGSLTAAASFPLAAGNTNPQGIADPPSGIEVASPLTGTIASPNTGVGGQIASKRHPSRSPVASLRGTDHIDLLLSEKRGPSARPDSFSLSHSLSESNEDAATDAAFAEFDATTEHTLDSVVALLAAY
jgi:hypothetical protein